MTEITTEAGKRLITALEAAIVAIVAIVAEAVMAERMAERSRLAVAVRGHGSTTGMSHKSPEWQDGHEEMRAAVLALLEEDAR